MIVQQQRPFLRRGVLQIPDFPIKEVRVLRVDPGDLVVRDRQRFRTGGPLLDLLVGELEPLHHAPVRPREFSLQLAE